MTTNKEIVHFVEGFDAEYEDCPTISCGYEGDYKATLKETEVTCKKCLKKIGGYKSKNRDNEKLWDKLALVENTHDIPTDFVDLVSELIQVAEVASVISDMRRNETEGPHYRFEDWNDTYEDLRHRVESLLKEVNK